MADGKVCLERLIDFYRKADLRGWVSVDAVCKMVDDAAETCTLEGPIQETIDGPVASLWGWVFGDL